MKVLNTVITVGDLRKKIEDLDDSIELEVSLPSETSPITAYPLQSVGKSFKVKDTKSMEQVGPTRLTLFPLTKAHVEANPDSYSKELKDRIQAIGVHICMIKE